MKLFHIVSEASRTWVRLYTLGLPVDLRDARRDEIDADLWEHEHDLRKSGESSLTSSIEILLRSVLGVHDDLSWRVEALQARRAASLDRRTLMLIATARHIRWMGLAGMVGGLLWAGHYLLPVQPTGATRAFGSTALSALFVLAILGFYAQQRASTGRVGLAGFILLLTSFLSLFTLNVLGSLLDLSRDALVANILGVTFAFLLAPGFLLLGLGMRDRARRIPLAIGAVFLVWMFLPRGILLRWFPSSGELLRRGGDSPLGMAVFFLMGIALALMGYSAFRRASAQVTSR